MYSGGPARPGAAKAEELDNETFETWIRRSAKTRTAREALALGIRGVFSVQPADLSVLHALFYAASAGGWDELLEVEGGPAGPGRRRIAADQPGDGR